MAKLSSGFGFTGSIGNVSAYTMRGVDGIILRSPGGASKEKIKTSDDFIRTREMNAEFGGRANAGKWVRNACSIQASLADYNITGPINALLLAIQKLDAASPAGKRNVVLSKNPRLLEGFSFNRKNTFDSTLRNPLSYTLLRETRSASIEIPDLVPGINFFAPDKYPVYSVRAILGVAPDVFYKEHDPKYRPSSRDYRENHYVQAETGWRPVHKAGAATTLQLNIAEPLPDQYFSLVLTIGVRYGMMPDAGIAEQVKYTGCAKILAMA